MEQYLATSSTRSEPSPWRDFSEEEQRLMRNLLRRMRDLRGKRFEVSMLRDGRLEIVEVDRRIIVGRGVLH